MSNPAIIIRSPLVRIGLILILYGVGLVAEWRIPDHGLWEQSWLILVLSLLLVYPYNAHRSFHLTSLGIALAGFILEWVGVHTGLVFGTYTYGNNLGILIDGVPPVIGLNWWIVVAGSLGLIQTILPAFKHPWMLTPLVLLILDFFIEQLAGHLGFWYWQDETIPLQNYAAWMAFGTLLAWWLHRSGKTVNLGPPRTLYLIQLLFFGSLYMLNLCG